MTALSLDLPFVATRRMEASGREHHFVLAADSGLSSNFLRTGRMTAVRAHTELKQSATTCHSALLREADIGV